MDGYESLAFYCVLSRDAAVAAAAVTAAAQAITCK